MAVSAFSSSLLWRFFFFPDPELLRPLKSLNGSVLEDVGAANALLPPLYLALGLLPVTHTVIVIWCKNKAFSGALARNQAVLKPNRASIS
jgi:hypothetical protein